MEGNKRNKLLGQIKSFMVDLCIALLIVLVINGFLVQNLRVDGNSMYPLLSNGNMVVINKMAYRFTSPKRGEIIGFYSDKLDNKVVKRIVGMPGDLIDFDNNMLYVNGQPLDKPSEVSIYTKGDIRYPYKVADNTYFVVGDNYNQSIDSRFNFIGAVRKEEIIGRIDFRIWPFWNNPFLK